MCPGCLKRHVGWYNAIIPDDADIKISSVFEYFYRKIFVDVVNVCAQCTQSIEEKDKEEIYEDSTVQKSHYHIGSVKMGVPTH